MNSTGEQPHVLVANRSMVHWFPHCFWLSWSRIPIGTNKSGWHAHQALTNFKDLLLVSHHRSANIRWGILKICCLFWREIAVSTFSGSVHLCRRLDYGHFDDWLLSRSASPISLYLGSRVCRGRGYARWCPSDHTAITWLNQYAAKLALKLMRQKWRNPRLFRQLFIKGERIENFIAQVSRIASATQ